MSLKYNGKLIPRAKELRTNMTRQEKHLWYDFLSRYPLRFQRQKTIDGFIVDFYCHKAKLVVEIDGAQHYEKNAKIYDAERTRVLNSYSLEVIRFANSDIDHNFSGVCTTIDQKIKERLSCIT